MATLTIVGTPVACLRYFVILAIMLTGASTIIYVVVRDVAFVYEVSRNGIERWAHVERLIDIHRGGRSRGLSTPSYEYSLNVGGKEFSHRGNYKLPVGRTIRVMMSDKYPEKVIPGKNGDGFWDLWFNSFSSSFMGYALTMLGVPIVVVVLWFTLQLLIRWKYYVNKMR